MLQALLSWGRLDSPKAVGIIVAAVALLYLGFGLLPAHRTWSDLWDEHERLQAEVSSSLRLNSRDGQVDRNPLRVNLSADDPDDIVPQEDRLAEVLSEISTLSAESGLRTDQIKRQADKSGDQVMELSFAVRAKGSYPQLASFLSRVQQTKRLTDVTKLHVRGDAVPALGTSQLEIDYELRTFRRLEGTSSMNDAELSEP